jgi:hypothetical protein
MKSLIINSPCVRAVRHWVELRPNTPLVMAPGNRQGCETLHQQCLGKASSGR